MNKDTEGGLPENTPETLPEEGDVMGLLDHLEELRFVLMKSVTVLFLCMVLVTVFAVPFAGLLYWPLEQAHVLAGDSQAVDVLRTDGPLSVFSFLLQLGFFGGLGLALPYVVYQLARFVAPGLTPQERRLLRPVCFAILVLFILGTALSFFLLLPASLAVSLKLNQAFAFQPFWTPGNYFGVLIWMTIGLGIFFQFPLILIILQYLDILPAKALRHYRRYAFLLILVFAAFITPPDPFSLMLMAPPLYLLYEGAILVGERLVARKRRKEAKEGGPAWDDL